MTTQYFPEVSEKIQYEGSQSDNPLAFKYYDADRLVAGKPMKEHLKFAVAYWHTMQGTGSDPFGGGVYDRPWKDARSDMDSARYTLDAAFEFFAKLTVPYWCFHDRDIAPEGATIAESAANLQIMVDHAQALQQTTACSLLWGTANLFSHPRYTHGAATNPDPLVMAYAAAQVRHAIDATIQLSGQGYTFWGGREGYCSLINTNMQQEREQMAAFLHMAKDYARSQGFKGALYIEPKPGEPMTHQYDYDAATVLGFLREFDLQDDFLLNIEANHCTLAKHSFAHDLTVATSAGMLGSVDANAGANLGWDTDEYPTNLYECVWALLIILQAGGFRSGGFNFDAKVRRGSFDTLDLFYGHISGMDTLAHALLIADKIIQDDEMDTYLQQRYAGYQQGIGAKIMQGKASLVELEQWAISQGEPLKISGRQELRESLFNRYVMGGLIK
ncbi:MAG: xylose isomerase [Methyloprofundus sp.]|nr:MAG: xylose isomerase [Methyloprofundus sp.]